MSSWPATGGCPSRREDSSRPPLAPAIGLQHPTCWDRAPRSQQDDRNASARPRRSIAGTPAVAGAAPRPARPRAARPGAPLQRGRAPGTEADVGRGLRLALHRRGARSSRNSCSIPPRSRPLSCTMWWRIPTCGSRTSPVSSVPRSPSIVDGLTKISHLTFRSSAEEQVENYRKLLLSIAKDARVIIIKLCDRLHNMRTLEQLHAEQRQRIATRDARDLRPAGAPLRHGAYQGGAGGPRVQVPRAGRLPGAGRAGGRRRGRHASR